MNSKTNNSDGNENICENSEVKMATTNTNDNLNEKPTKNDDKDQEKSLDNDTTPTTTESTSLEKQECVDLKIVYNKQKIDINFKLDSTVGELKLHLESIISVPKAMQKVMIKGLARDEETLRNLGVTNGAKIMIVGAKLNDVLAMTAPSKEEVNLLSEFGASSSKEPLAKQQVHKKILDKGIPEDAMPGILSANDPLPEFPLSGMVNKRGGKVRLTFKLEQDQLWIGTKERTEKVSMNSIKGVVNEPIPDKPQYHMMAIQLGPTEASRYWIYWVPAQYVGAIKDAILGKWGYF